MAWPSPDRPESDAPPLRSPPSRLPSAPTRSGRPGPDGLGVLDTFASVIDDDTIKAQADALVSSGMAAAGYKYVNIDEGWWLGTRDGNGDITVDTAKWPAGRRPSSTTSTARASRPGSTPTRQERLRLRRPDPLGTAAAPNTGMEGHHQQDLETFQNWGLDFLKIDWCGGDAEGLHQETTYQAIRDANTAAYCRHRPPARPVAVRAGHGNPWNWAAGTGAMWRTEHDIVDDPTTR